jgi:CRISPR system Cascade subunit CasE
MNMHLTQATLLLPSALAGNNAAEHRLIHSLFSGGDPDAKREFIYSPDTPSSDGRARYLIISSKPPANSSIFSVRSREFNPKIKEGDQLRFNLIANPTVTQKDANGKTVRRDVVMHSIYNAPKHDRNKIREGAIQTAGFNWLSRQSERCGFSVDPNHVDISDYEQSSIERDGSNNLKLSRITYRGLLTVTDPDLFIQTLARGIGRGRAFGCGMLKVVRTQ